MKNTYNEAVSGILPPDFYYGDIVEADGVFKLEWHDPVAGTTSLLTEEDLRAKEEESRLSLCRSDNPVGSEGWKIQRNINYSAEYGLEALQRHKLSLSRPLETSFRPVVPNRF